MEARHAGFQPESRKLATLVCPLFESWNARGIAFVVLRDYERLPEETSNDIDVLVRPRQAREAERIMLAVAQNAGYVLHNRVRFSPTAYYFHERATGRQLQIDVFQSIEWRSFTLIPAGMVLAARRDHGLFAVPTPGHEALISLLMPLLHGGRIKHKHTRHVLERLRAAPAEAHRALAPAVGERLARRVLEVALAERWDHLEALVPLLRFSLISRQVARHPGRWLESVTAALRRVTERLRHPPGMVVVLVRNSHSGSVASRVAHSLRHTFSPGKGVHFSGRMGSASRLRATAGAIRLAWCARLALFRNGLVLMETVLPPRERDTQQQWPHVRAAFSALSRFGAPRPDLIFDMTRSVHGAMAGVEHSPAVSTIQGRIADGTAPAPVIIDAPSSDEEVVSLRVSRHVLRWMTERCGRRMLSSAPR